jgi:hypothetical protein
VDLGARVRSVVSFLSGETIEADHPAPAFEPGATISASVVAENIRLFARR